MDRKRAKAGKPPPLRLPEKPRPCGQCGGIMEHPRPGQRFCNESCRNRNHCARQKATARPRFRRLRCHWCSGKHMTAACPNRTGECVKQFGTLGPNREYVPPPGVKVRVVHAPYNAFADQLDPSTWRRR